MAAKGRFFGNHAVDLSCMSETESRCRGRRECFLYVEIVKKGDKESDRPPPRASGIVRDTVVKSRRNGKRSGK
jgi:hypothetical protein